VTDDLDVWVRMARKQIRREQLWDDICALAAWLIVFVIVGLVLHLAG